MRYFGGKNCAGTFQRIINQMPPHGIYVEPFAGSAAVYRRKRPAERNVLIDLDPGAIDALRDGVLPDTLLIVGNALDLLEVSPYLADRRALLYVDPPYLHETRRSRHRYRYELTEADHHRLLTLLKGAACMVMLSGYASMLYDRALAGWRRDSFEVITRGGRTATEVLWMNFPEPTALHDYRFLGRDFREREKFARQRRRWIARLRGMDTFRRQALLAALAEVSVQEASPPPAMVAATAETRGHRRKGRGRPGQTAAGDTAKPAMPPATPPNPTMQPTARPAVTALTKPAKADNITGTVRRARRPS